MKRRNKILIAAILVLVLGFLFLRPGGGHRRAVEAYKKELRAKGEKLTMIELAPPKSASASSAASALTNAVTNFVFPPDYPSMMKMLAPGVAMMGHTNVEPGLMTSHKSNALKMAEIRVILKAPEIRFDLNYSEASDINLPALAKLKAIGNLASGTVMQALYQKDYPGAWSNLLAAVNLVRLCNSEPFLISDLVRIAMARIAMGATWEALQVNEWTGPQLAELQSKWERSELFNKSEASLDMERAWNIDAFAKARKTNDGQAFMGLYRPMGATSVSWGNPWEKIKELYARYPRFWMWRASWSFEEEHYYLRVIEATKETVRRMKNAGAFVPALTEFERQSTNEFQLQAGQSNHFFGVFGVEPRAGISYLKKLASTETARRLVVVAIALRRYQLEHGTYPADLSKLVPKYLQSVPMDFMDGKPLRYRLNTDGSFTLYSTGDDGVDDDGDALGSGRDWMRGRDAVWPRAATPEEVEQFNKTNAPPK